LKGCKFPLKSKESRHLKVENVKIEIEIYFYNVEKSSNFVMIDFSKHIGNIWQQSLLCLSLLSKITFYSYQTLSCEIKKEKDLKNRYFILIQYFFISN
jgi:hypothetical protein